MSCIDHLLFVCVYSQLAFKSVILANIIISLFLSMLLDLISPPSATGKLFVFH